MHLLSTYYVPGTVLGIHRSKSTIKSPSLWGFHSRGEEKPNINLNQLITSHEQGSLQYKSRLGEALLGMGYPGDGSLKRYLNENCHGNCLLQYTLPRIEQRLKGCQLSFLFNSQHFPFYDMTFYYPCQAQF